MSDVLSDTQDMKGREKERKKRRREEDRGGGRGEGELYGDRRKLCGHRGPMETRRKPRALLVAVQGA